jgi:hypothetical protein
MTAHRRLTLTILSIAFLALVGCANRDSDAESNLEKGTSIGDAGGSGSSGFDDGGSFGQTPTKADPADPSFAPDLSKVESSGLPPAGKGQQLPGVLGPDGFLGDVPLMFLPGRLPQSLLPNYTYQPPRFPNPDILRLFLCIELMDGSISRPSVGQAIQAWNFVTSLYVKLAGRLPRPAEMRQQLRLLANVDSVTDREAAARRVIMSSDHLSVLISVVYETFLGRAASQQEIDHWAQKLRSSHKYEDFVIAVAASAERQNRVGGRNATDRINNMIVDTYRKVLGREASARGRKSEREYWLRFVLNEQRRGKNLQQALTAMVSGIVRSDENRWKVAEHTTKRMLESAATWNHVRTAYERLRSSNGDLLAVMQWLMGTNEYFQLVRGRYVQNLTRQWCEANAEDFFQTWLR